MADCHCIQKLAIDDAKLLTISTASFSTSTKHSETSPPKPPRSATDLESELQNWCSSFATWIASQCSYGHALASWAHCCVGSTDDNDDDSLPTRWSRLMEESSVGEEWVVDGLDFFVAGIGSVYWVEEEAIMWRMTAEKMAELAGRVLCAGMSVAIGSQAEFAVKVAEGHHVLVEERTTV